VNGVAVAAAKSCSLRVENSEIEVSSPTTGNWRQFIAGRNSWVVSTGHLVLAVKSNVTLVGTMVTLSFEVGGSSTDNVSGSALVKQWDVSGAVGNLAQGSFQFTGSGALG
jgi:predicted secreted protein